MSLVLESPRLKLRTFLDTDLVVFADYRSDPEVARYQSWETPYTRKQAAAFIAKLKTVVPGKPGEWCQLALTLKTNGKMIGDCAFCVLEQDPLQAEIGFTLAHPYWGQGYATEAINRLLEYLFVDLNLHRVRANCDPENVASARLLERVGMRREGHFVESLWFKGRWSSEYWYAILRQEWESKRGAG